MQVTLHLYLQINPTFCDIEIEEVTVEHCLDTASYNSNKVKKALKVEAVDPVEDIEGTVGTQGKQIMAGDGLCLPCLADHEQLGQDGHRFQIDGKRPQDLNGGEENQRSTMLAFLNTELFRTCTRALMICLQTKTITTMS